MPCLQRKHFTVLKYRDSVVLYFYFPCNYLVRGADFPMDVLLNGLSIQHTGFLTLAGIEPVAEGNQGNDLKEG